MIQKEILNYGNLIFTKDDLTPELFTSLMIIYKKDFMDVHKQPWFYDSLTCN
jgi:hypothetical protein